MTKPGKEEINNLGRYFAITSNNDFWRLSEKALSNEEKNELLTAAFTSLYHWKQVGDDENKYLALLGVARALTINNIPDLAVEYAHQAYDFFQDSEQKWIQAFTNAILSHALLISGNYDKAASYYFAAQNIGNELEPEDKEVFDATFSLIPKPTK